MPKVLPATGDGRRFELHAFVCTSDSSCAIDGPAKEIHAWLKESLRASGRKEEIRVNKAGCLGQCGHGPMMVVYPEGIWYCHLGLDDAQEIWYKHIVGGVAVARLRYATPNGGTNVLPRVPGEAPDRSSPWYQPCSRCPT